MRRATKVQIIVIVLCSATLLAVYAPRVIERVYELRSQHAIEAAGKIAAAMAVVWEDEVTPVSPDEQLRFSQATLEEFLALRFQPDGPALDDYLDVEDLFTMEKLTLSASEEGDYRITVDFRAAYGRYRRCEVTPEGIEWQGR
ncbi:MAG: hypothetical protein ACLFS8_05665 [Clostridia bacterium]